MTDTAALVRRLAGLESRSGLVTVALDVADSGILPAATRIFLKDHVYPALEKGQAERLRRFLDADLRPESDGAFVVTGSDTWEVAELRAPLENFIRVGPAPYLPPLLQAFDRRPRVYVLRYSEREALLQEFGAGGWSELHRLRRAGLDVVPHDPERRLTGPPVIVRRSPRLGGSGIGGGRRDRFDDTVEDASAEMLADAARRTLTLHARAPAERVLAYGDRELFPYFRDRLPAGLAGKAAYAGPAPAPTSRAELRFRDGVRRDVERFHRERVEDEIREFHERRAQGWRVALGPGDVLAHAETGRLERVYMDPAEEVEVLRCPGCGLAPRTAASCAACGERLVRASLTAELAARSVTHPPLPITFVPRGSAWLRELGGLAALLAGRGFRRKK